MKKSVKETLKLAVEQLFVRIHGDLFSQIYSKGSIEFKVTQLAYDEGNEAHLKLVSLCKEKIGYEPIATNQDIFYSIMRVYSDAKERERVKAKANLKR
ncbi:MAG: hypothetical protein GQ574_23580 [Crocinitomix sp.]|nr:hypothetical protein [Crocinitomix sp.]